MGIAGLCLLSERDIKISLSMIRNDGRSINKAVGSARQFFTAESVIAWLCYLKYDKNVP